MSLKKLIFVTIATCLFQYVSAQRNYDQNNHIGLWGGLTFFDISTTNFNTEQATGYALGFTTRGAFYNNFDITYGINFTQNEIGILANDLANTSSNFSEQFVDYTIQSAQVSLLGSYNIVNNHLSVEFGPILNVNGKMKLKREGFEEFTVDGYENLKAEDIQNVSRVHFVAAGGITVGIENFRAVLQYHYGVTNLFDRLNDLDIEQPSSGKFKGNTSTIIAGVVLYL